jgi:predicted TIM-barrel fold metal-dependent hydrolase
MPGDPNEICTPMRPAQSLERPVFEMPAGACDAHMHVFEARGEFPSKPLRYPNVPDANYTLPDGGLHHYLNLMPVLGIDNFVIVQPSFYGTDNTCLIDALAEAGPIARGIVNIEPSTSDAELERLHDAGVRGVRLDLFKRASLPIAEVQAYIRQMAARVAPLGWHLQFYTPGAIVRDSMDMLAELEIEFVVDHMGYMLAKDGLTEDDFGRMLDLLRDGHCWLKLSAPYRLARHSSMEAVDRVASAIVAAAPQKVLWGSDWPHIPEGTRDTGELLNALATWAPDAATRRMILVDNPRQLFDFAAVLVEQGVSPLRFPHSH